MERAGARLFGIATSLAQQRPGQHLDQTNQIPGEHGTKPTGKDAEIDRLKALVEQQNKKIALLEEKVRLLEAELKKSKGASK